MFVDSPFCLWFSFIVAPCSDPPPGPNLVPANWLLRLHAPLREQACSRLLSYSYLFLQPPAHLRVFPQAGQPAMHQHADVSFLAARDLGDLPIHEPFAPQVDRLPLSRGQLADQLAQATG